MDDRLKKFQNKLIVFEGVDHSTKSTQAKMLYDRLIAEGINVILTKQPGDAPGELGTMTRSLCIDKKWNLHPLSNLFAFLLDRCEHVNKVIIPALESGKTVICDRWGYSTIAYQFYGKELLDKYNLNIEFAEWLNNIASANIKPDIVFYVERKTENLKKTKDDDFDQFETASDTFKLRVSNAYQMMLHKYEDLFIKIPVIENDIKGTFELILNSEV